LYNLHKGANVMNYKRKNSIVSILVLLATQALLGVNTELAKQQKLRSQTIKNILEEQPYIEGPSVLTRMSTRNHSRPYPSSSCSSYRGGQHNKSSHSLAR